MDSKWVRQQTFSGSGCPRLGSNLDVQEATRRIDLCGQINSGIAQTPQVTLARRRDFTNSGNCVQTAFFVKV